MVKRLGRILEMDKKIKKTFGMQEMSPASGERVEVKTPQTKVVVFFKKLCKWLDFKY